MKFKVLGGGHSESNYESGPKQGRPIVYKKGDVFESATDHAQKYPDRYKRMPDDAQVTDIDELDIGHMDANQLAAFAKLNGVQVGSRRRETVAALKEKAKEGPLKRS